MGAASLHRFGNVLGQSGSFWWSSDGHGLSGADVIASIDGSIPVRFRLEAGALEHTLLAGNRDLVANLTKHGFDAQYRQYPGGHDFACRRGGLPDGLGVLMRP